MFTPVGEEAHNLDKESIYQGNSIISIETLPDYAHPVAVKKSLERHPSRLSSRRSLENEYEMTRSLDAVEGVRRALGLQSIDNRPALILEYIEGETLLDCISKKTLNLLSKLEIAVNLARVLGEIHQQNVIHQDLNSENILVSRDLQSVHIIDLGSAAPIVRGGHQRVQPDQVLGTLSYVAPEQTGRINRAVDERSDFYSLGVVLYEVGPPPHCSRTGCPL
jgi:serine/threonine protein kinase